MNKMPPVSLAEILTMMRRPQPSGLGQVSNIESDAMRAAIEGAAVRGMPRLPVDMNEMQKSMLEAYRQGGQAGVGQVSDAEAQRLRQALGANPALSLPAAEGMPNYADGQAPMAIGGGLLADEAQMLMNTAYDMSAPREMRINAINRLRELGY